MRYHFIARSRDKYGTVKPNIPINVYEANTVIPAHVYLEESGGTVITTVPQLSSDVNGLFSFYIDTIDYPVVPLFDIVMDSITYENIDIGTSTKANNGANADITSMSNVTIDCGNF